MLLGLVANEVVNHALKSYFQAPRPTTCELLGVCDTYGLPSSHAQCALYFVAMRLLVSSCSVVWPARWFDLLGGSFDLAR